MSISSRFLSHLSALTHCHLPSKHVRGLSAVERSGDKGQRWFFPSGIGSNGRTTPVSSQSHENHYLAVENAGNVLYLTANSSNNTQIYAEFGINGTQMGITFRTADYYIDGSAQRKLCSSIGLVPFLLIHTQKHFQ